MILNNVIVSIPQEAYLINQFISEYNKIFNEYFSFAEVFNS